MSMAVATIAHTLILLTGTLTFHESIICTAVAWEHKYEYLLARFAILIDLISHF